VVVVFPVVTPDLGGKPDVVAAEHLTGRLIARNARIGVAVRLRTIVVEEAKFIGLEEAVHQVLQLGHGLPDNIKPDAYSRVNVGDEVAVVEGRRGLH